MSLTPNARRRALWRFAAAAVLVIACIAATTAVAGLLQVKTIVGYINLTSPLKHAQVTLPAPGAPETVLLVGSDHRAGTPYSSANTDTMMLVRIDDSSSTINVLSVPRDLEVQLPVGGGATGNFKLNAAYSLGGTNLLITTLKQQVFPGLVVNHIVDLNFAGFSDLVDAIGCVYSDVDHRYYNNTAQTNYSSIDIQPGYQRLCGANQSIGGALAFVRFRHTDSDIVRNARQQDFIRWAKDQYGVSQLIANESKLLRIFGTHAQTDKSLHTTDGLIDLFDLILDADGHQIKSIPFPAILGPCSGNAQTPCYVTSTSAAEAVAYKRFMTPSTATSEPAPVSTPATVRRTPATVSSAGLVSAPGDGHSQSAQLGSIPMPVYYPSLIVAGSQYCFSITANCDDYPNPDSEYKGSYPRAYLIHAPDGTPHDAYVLTLMISSDLGEYYTVQGTTWLHPPILDSPTQTRTVDGKTLLEYSQGGKLSLVAWRTPQAVYWVSNTLANEIPNSQMIAIAASLTPYLPGAK
ncbi:MAG: LCP family protein [Solirubrobacteraceae bacterium]